MATPQEKFAEIEARLRREPQRVAGLNATFQFELTGENGGVWHVVVADSDGRLLEGPAENPGVIIQMSSDDFVALADGRLNPTAAFMAGKLKVKGDMGLAMRLQSLLQ